MHPFYADKKRSVGVVTLRSPSRSMRVLRWPNGYPCRPGYSEGVLTVGGLRFHVCVLIDDVPEIIGGQIAR